jgi:hypothetical protein
VPISRLLSSTPLPTISFVGTKKTDEANKAVYLVNTLELPSLFEEPLTFHHRWAYDHNWEEDSGLRQLAFDILAYYFHETPSFQDIRKEAKGSMAWLPHLKYTGELWRWLQPTNGSEKLRWELTIAHVDAWVTSWGLANHRKFALSRYQTSYGGETFDEWFVRLQNLISEHGGSDHATSGITMIWAWTAYLSGYSAAHIAFIWAANELKRMREIVTPGLNEVPMDTWEAIPRHLDLEW